MQARHTQALDAALVQQQEALVSAQVTLLTHLHNNQCSMHSITSYCGGPKFLPMVHIQQVFASCF